MQTEAPEPEGAKSGKEQSIPLGLVLAEQAREASSRGRKRRPQELVALAQSDARIDAAGKPGNCCIQKISAQLSGARLRRLGSF